MHAVIHHSQFRCTHHTVLNQPVSASQNPMLSRPGTLYLSPHPRSPNEVFATLSLITPRQKGLASASASHSSRSTSRYSAESFSSCFRLKSPLSSASYQSCVPCSVIHLPHLSGSVNLTCRQKWARALLTAAWCGLMLRELTFTNRPSGFAGNFIIYRSHSPAPVI